MWCGCFIVACDSGPEVVYVAHHENLRSKFLYQIKWPMLGQLGDLGMGTKSLFNIYTTSG